MTSTKNVVVSLLFSIIVLSYSVCALFVEPDVYTLAEKEPGIKLPVVMYHLILDDEKRLGKFVISPDELERDMKYLKDNDFNPVVFSDLINYTEKNIDLPPNPIMITFDDGYYNNYLFAYPVLKKYGFKAVLSIIGTESEKYSSSGEVSKYYSHVTFENMKEMSDVFEIQNHSYNLHEYSENIKGAKKTSKETSEVYVKRLYDDLLKCHNLIKDNTGITPCAFAFPFGSMSYDAHSVISDKMGYKGSLSCIEGINYITKDKQSLYKLKRYNRPSGIKSDEFFVKINAIQK
ncbi:MAG: polysaccharide deacetylase family protein [Ruminococcaceae bacterium]|nr:polysaccharide deacetylase family protein [Oscillospiraceae bacterium]